MYLMYLTQHHQLPTFMVIPTINIYECFNDLHHELAKPFPSTTFLQLNLVAIEDIVIKVHVIPVVKT